MDASRRAVDAYWRSKMIDAATSDEDKVAPVYKLEEICELLRSSPVGIVKEVSEFILKRLQHRSPIVKQKALRVIKYAVGKSGVEFRREMQRNSVIVRQLIHYKGQPDPLKGDALNKAVRETAQEALSALFASDDNKPAPAENLAGRIQGFGNTNFEMPSDDRKSFLSEVVGIGSATIRQGISNLTQSPSLKKNDTGSYRSPNLQRSLTTETDYSDRYEGINSHGENRNASRFSQNANSRNWNQELGTSQTESTNGDSSFSGEKTREMRLLETIVTSGGIRLQPTRDALHAFVVEASKLDALGLIHALESKLQAPSWQVRVRAVCVLEAILRKKDDEHFSVVASYFSDNKDVLVKCSESPQASLREKANKVLNLLDGEPAGDVRGHVEKPVKTETSTIQMPDLIDTGDADYLFGTEDSAKPQSSETIMDPPASATPLIDDLFGNSSVTGVSTSQHKNDDDPFADVDFHGNPANEHEADLFSGMTIDETGATDAQLTANKGVELFDIFGPVSEAPQGGSNVKKDVNDLMSSLSINGNDLSRKEDEHFGGTPAGNIFPGPTVNPTPQLSGDAFNGLLAQVAGMNANPMFPLGSMAYNFPAGFVLNPSFASQSMDYNAMGSLLAQQQFLATMSSFQQLGRSMQPNAVGTDGGYSSPLPDIFNPSSPVQTPTSLLNSSKKEDTKAFDFISDHLAAARDPKRVI